MFSDPRVVKGLLRSFVHEKFVDDLDFSSMKKLNTKFIPVSENSRQADLVFEINLKGQTAYIYLFIEFQSTVDRFMALRMARYQFEFYQEIQTMTKSYSLSPSFSILIYNGDSRWTAPERFSELLLESSIPKEYLPEFKYFKIAINEIPKRELVKLRNAAAGVFYIENEDILSSGKNIEELVSLLNGILEKDGGDLVRALVNRIYEVSGFEGECKELERIEDLTKVGSMLELNVKRWKEKMLEEGIEKGIELGLEQGKIDSVTRLVELGMDDTFIVKATGLPIEKVQAISKTYRAK